MKATLRTTLMKESVLSQSKAEIPLIRPQPGDRPVENDVVNLYPDFTYQTITGFGGAMTEAAAWSLSQLEPARREQALREYFGPEGSGYTLIRTHIDSSDFSLGMYQAVPDVLSDPDLAGFSLDRDRRYIIPAIREAMKLSPSPLSVLLSPWSPPAEWKTEPAMLRGVKSMEDFKKLFPPELASAEAAETHPVMAAMRRALEKAITTGMGIRTCGGHLKPEFYPSWAAYLVRYVQEYLAEGVPVRFLSIQNEAQAATPWDSCEWTAEEEKVFLRDHLYPAMKEAGLSEKVGIYFWDHNRENLVDRALAVLDEETLPMVQGAAFHWYSGDHYEAPALVHERFPRLKLMFSEGCCEYIPSGDSRELSHALKYAHDILSCLNAGMDAWFDWNLFLDEKGGPNHVGNFCSAPIMLDGQGGYEKRAAYAYIRQISEAVRPGAVRIGFSRYTDQLDVAAFRNPDGSLVCILLNRSGEEKKVNLRLSGNVGAFSVPACAVSVLNLE